VRLQAGALETENSGLCTFFGETIGMAKEMAIFIPKEMA
jgi:hypothetical protein